MLVDTETSEYNANDKSQIRKYGKGFVLPKSYQNSVGTFVCKIPE